MSLELKLFRYSSQKIDTFGMLKDETGQFFCYSLEDERRNIKVSGETRIPEGRYKLIVRKELTPLTIKHRANYNKNEIVPWFTFHIEISGVPNFSGIYIHAGNTEKHTEGCLLLGNIANNNAIVAGYLSDSIAACKRFYKKYFPLIEAKEDVYLTITNI